MKPLHAALTSSAAAFTAPRRSCTKAAVEGNCMSPLMVPMMIPSRSFGSTPAIASASFDAASERSEHASWSAAMRRSRMPVRVTIHSSDVSTIFSRSKLVRTRAGV